MIYPGHQVACFRWEEVRGGLRLIDEEMSPVVAGGVA